MNNTEKHDGIEADKTESSEEQNSTDVIPYLPLARTAEEQTISIILPNKDCIKLTASDLDNELECNTIHEAFSNTRLSNDERVEIIRVQAEKYAIQYMGQLIPTTFDFKLFGLGGSLQMADFMLLCNFLTLVVLNVAVVIAQIMFPIGHTQIFELIVILLKAANFYYTIKIAMRFSKMINELD